MLTFAISTKLHLTKKPTWLDSFRRKYNQTYDFHVTLKQPCLVDDESVQRIKETLTSFFQSYKISERQLLLTFDMLVIEPESDGRMTVMVNAQENSAIRELQKAILNLFPGDARYRNPESKEWEQNFQPHMTIATDLDKVVYEEARKEIGNDVRCEGYIDAVTLDLVNEKNGDTPAVERIELRF